MLEKPLLMRIDQVIYGYICENPKYFEDEIAAMAGNARQTSTQDIYRIFKERFDLQIKPRKMRD